MSQQAGNQLYQQSMNGLITIDNAETIECFELDAEIINVDDLTVNNLLTVPNISNTTIGTITQTGTNIITQTGTEKNIFKNTDFTGDVDINGNLNVSGSLTYDIVDIDCENLIVQNDSSLNDLYVGGVLTMGSSLTSYINQPSKTGLPGFPITRNHLTLTNIQGLEVEESLYVVGYGLFNNNITQLLDSFNTFRGQTEILGTLYTPNTIVRGTLSQTDAYIISQTGTGTNLLKDTTIGILTQTGSNYITQSGTGTNLLKDTTIGILTQTGTNIITQTGTGTNLLKNTTIGILTQTGTNIITQTGTGTNILKDTEITGNLVVDNVSDFLPDTDVETYIFDEELLTDVVATPATEITFFTFKVRGTTQSKNFIINLSFPLSNFQTGTQNISPNTVTNTLFGASNQSFVLRRNGLVVSYTTPSYTNGGTKSYSITGIGDFTYQQYLSMFSCEIPFTEVALGTSFRTYTVGIALAASVIIPTPARINPSTFNYKINTTITGFNATGGLVTNLNGFYTDYAIGSYSIINTDYVNPTTLYTNYDGTLVNNSLVNNNLFNRAQFNNIVSITTTPYELLTTNSYYFIQKASAVQINLPYINNSFIGFTVNIRKAYPTGNSNKITINASVNGCLYYHNNMTPTSAHIDYNNDVGWILIYGGDGDWYLLNSF